MKTKLIEQKIKVSGWNEMYETTIKYPEDLEFYYTADEIGIKYVYVRITCSSNNTHC